MGEFVLLSKDDRSLIQSSWFHCVAFLANSILPTLMP